jgi:hypothetical protein
MTKKKANTNKAVLEEEFDQMIRQVRNKKSALRKMLKEILNPKNENNPAKKPDS